MLKSWISAMRLRTLPLALASIGMGSFLAASKGGFSLSVFVMALLTTLCLQILSNLANDYGDSIHGADHSNRQGPSREVQSGKISRSQMKTAIGFCAVITLIVGICLLWIAGVPKEVFLAFAGLGCLAMLAAVLYTNGARPYGYIGLGDISVFLFFGWLGVLGVYYLMTKRVELDLLLPGSACGLFTVAVLNVNNIRDIDSDLEAGKYSIPVRLGRHRATWYHIALLIVGLLLAITYTVLHYNKPIQLLYLIIIPLLFINGKAIVTKTNAQDLDPYLKQMALTTLAFVLFFGVGILL